MIFGDNPNKISKSLVEYFIFKDRVMIKFKKINSIGSISLTQKLQVLLLQGGQDLSLKDPD